MDSPSVSLSALGGKRTLTRGSFCAFKAYYRVQSLGSVHCVIRNFSAFAVRDMEIT